MRVTNINGAGSQTQNGIKIIEVGGKSEGDFQLNSSYTHNGKAMVVARAYAYKLFKGGKTDPTDGYGFGATLTWAGDDGFYVDNQAQLQYSNIDYQHSWQNAQGLTNRT